MTTNFLGGCFKALTFDYYPAEVLKSSIGRWEGVVIFDVAKVTEILPIAKKSWFEEYLPI